MIREILLCGTFVLLAPLSGPLAAEWVELAPASAGAPAPRVHATAIHDPFDHRMILFGGQTANGFPSDIWAFDLETRVWVQLSPTAGAEPPGRITPNAVLDPDRRQMLVWAGQSTVFHNDVWAFDLAEPGWAEYQPANPEPNIRYGTASVFDPLTRDLVTFAGFTNAGRFQDTWRFDPDGVAWTDVSPSTDPGRRCLHSASYDARRHRMIMYGGQRSGALDDIWAFDLTTDSWENLTPADRPAGRFFSPQVYDVIRDRALIFGGRRQSGLTNDVWAFDLASESWTELAPGGLTPSAREGATAIYIVHEDRMIVFGGSSSTGLRNDVWSLELDTSGAIVFPDAISNTRGVLEWPIPATVDWVRGDLANVASYTVDMISTSPHATAIDDPSIPASGGGFFYLVRLSGDAGSWQNAPGSEPARDLILP